MAIRWSKEYDRLCGADLRNSLDAPVIDSGIHDWLYGRAERLDASEIIKDSLLECGQGKSPEELGGPFSGWEQIVKKGL